MDKVVQFKYPLRSSDSVYDCMVSKMYDLGNFDTALIALNHQTVEAHRFILAMFSEHFKNVFEEASLEDTARGLYFYSIENK